MLTKTENKAIISAFMSALMTTPFNDIDMRDVAARAKVPLAKMLMTYDSRIALFGAFASGIDEEVLAGDDPDMGGEPPRERLFDVFMRRFDALLPHKLALIQLERDVRRDPSLAMALVPIASKAMSRMAASADIDVSGPRGSMVMAGLLQVYARVMRVFLKEADEGQAQTMAELDKALRQAERRIGDVDGFMMLIRGQGGANGGPLCRLRERMNRNSSGAATNAEAA